MHPRRRFLKHTLGAAGSSLLLGAGISLPNVAQANSDTVWSMPDEAAPHRATWMAYGPQAAIWGPRLMHGARANLASIAKTIAQFEPVNMLVRAADYDIAAQQCGNSVQLIVQEIDDLWIRDTGAVFVKNQQHQIGAIDFHFNGWGNKQSHARDARVAAMMIRNTAVSAVATRLVLEGGAIEVDGDGSAIITESCVLNANRNPGVSKAHIETELKRLLGLNKIIWLPGIAGRDITDGHTDFYARFTEPGVVVAHIDHDPDSYDYAVTRRHLNLLRAATDAKGRKLEVIELPGPNSIRQQFSNDEFTAGYINFYVCNHAVICPQFGDSKTDRNTRDILRDLFPSRDVIQLNIDAIAAGGGGIHCATQQQIA
ncbi:agmatine/peptidylarginine deiminase [uncultured Deefgea sp.]|uniref:agmatine deiminase family protein n=1 Tax=uncultured Deefgea sp. TaxID=1304914 RepID=UPI002620E2E2|nr:agmatine deiminase family protein [uncultured Deefgea sp.]